MSYFGGYIWLCVHIYYKKNALCCSINNNSASVYTDQLATKINLKFVWSILTAIDISASIHYNYVWVNYCVCMYIWGKKEVLYSINKIIVVDQIYYERCSKDWAVKYALQQICWPREKTLNGLVYIW